MQKARDRQQPGSLTIKHYGTATGLLLHAEDLRLTLNLKTQVKILQVPESLPK